LDTTSARNAESRPFYDPEAALVFFRSAAKPQTIPKGTMIFSESVRGAQRQPMSDRIYLLLQGEVGVVANGEPIATIVAGEIFGEMASLGRMPRSASAVAKTECRVIGLDETQFDAALGRDPGFALMLLSIMASRLRDTIARVGAPGGGWREAAVLDKQLLADLAQVVGPVARFRHPAGKIIMREGQRGAALYAVLEGRVAVRIGDTVVEKVGPGGIFGETSLVDRIPRLATAVAETDCVLLAMSRHMFLHLVKRCPKFGAAVLRAVGERAAFTASRGGEWNAAEPQAAPAQQGSRKAKAAWARFRRPR
jgi:CRP/FNR family transcriptional regulator, cyclic AMP receptor protein